MVSMSKLYPVEILNGFGKLVKQWLVSKKLMSSPVCILVSILTVLTVKMIYLSKLNRKKKRMQKTRQENVSI